jgi:hypothetical protein
MSDPSDDVGMNVDLSNTTLHELCLVLLHEIRSSLFHSRDVLKFVLDPVSSDQLTEQQRNQLLQAAYEATIRSEKQIEQIAGVLLPRIKFLT